MNIPLILRFGLAWAILTKDFLSISFNAYRTMEPGAGASYRFDVGSTAVKGWLKRRERRADIMRKAREDERARIVGILNGYFKELGAGEGAEKVWDWLEDNDPAKFEETTGV